MTETKEGSKTVRFADEERGTLCGYIRKWRNCIQEHPRILSGVLGLTLVAAGTLYKYNIPSKKE